MKREDRYQSVEELKVDVESYLGGFATSAEEAGLIAQLTLLVKRHKGMFGSVGIAFVLLAFVVGGFIIRLNAEKSRAEAEKLHAVHAKKEAVPSRVEAEKSKLETPRPLATFGLPRWLRNC